MTRFFVVVCALLGGGELAPVRAQFGCGPLCAPGYGYSSGYSYSYRSGFGFSVNGPHLRVSGFSIGFAPRPAFYVPPPLVPVAPFGPFGPVGLAPAPFVPFGNPALGPVWNGFGPPVVVAPIIIGGNLGDPEPLAGNPLPRNDPVLLPRGVPEANFLVIAPKRAAVVPDVARVAPRPPPPVIGAIDPFKPPVKVVAEVPDPDPKKESARQAKLARAAFAVGDYGRAAEHFERATASDPADARTYFLHAQARFAAGQYVEAVARVRDGLARDDKWPAAAFDPAEMYDGRVDRYAAHLAALKKAGADNPGQPALEFLLGYQLWFNGEKAEAEKLFRAAEKRLAAPGPIALFK